MRDRIPMEIVSSFLATTSVLLALPPFHLPPWALFIGWAGTVASGGPRKEVIKKMWKAMPIGGEMLTIFVFNGSMMLLGRTKWSIYVPGMFFGFASFFATYYGGWGPVKHNVWAAYLAVVIMNGLGPIYAWLNEKLAFPVAEQKER